MQSELTNTIKELFSCGIECFPGRVVSVNGEKRTHLPSWRHTTFTVDTAIRSVRNNHNTVVIKTGKCSNLWVLDVDAHEGKAKGQDTLDLMGVERNLSTPCQKTPSGGEHWFFKMPGSNGKTRSMGHVGLDCRGEGGLIFTGSEYEWVTRITNDTLNQPPEDVVSIFTGYKEEPEAPRILDPNDPLDIIPPVGLKLNDLQEKLSELDPDCSRDEWRNIGYAVHHETGGSTEGLEIWEDWSSGGAKFKEGEPERQWNSFGKSTERPITGAYLLKLTKKESEDTEDPNFFKNLNWSISRFLDEPPNIPLVVYNVLPRGIVSLFYSAGGAGKSTLIMYLCAKIALGTDYSTDFFGNAIPGGRVVIITAEDPDIILNRRFISTIKAISEELGISLSDARESLNSRMQIVSTFGHAVPLFKVKTNGLLVPTEYYNLLTDCLLDIDDLHLIIIDTKTRYSPAEGMGNVTATQEITYYEAIAQQTGASVMLLHHTSKVSRDGSQTGMQAYRDASAIYDSVRAAWYFRTLTDAERLTQDITEDESDKYFILENSKNNYIPHHKPMLIRREGFNYSLHDIGPKISKEARKERQKEDLMSHIITVLQDDGKKEFSQADILRMKDTFKCGKSRLIAALEDAVDCEILEKDLPVKGKPKIYRFTDYGLSYGLQILG